MCQEWVAWLFEHSVHPRFFLQHLVTVYCVSQWSSVCNNQRIQIFSSKYRKTKPVVDGRRKPTPGDQAGNINPVRNNMWLDTTAAGCPYVEWNFDLHRTQPGSAHKSNKMSLFEKKIVSARIVERVPLTERNPQGQGYGYQILWSQVVFRETADVSIS
jgi:hypothetical protein